MFGRHFVVGAGGLAFGSLFLLVASCGDSTTGGDTTIDAAADATVDTSVASDAGSVSIGPSGGSVNVNGVSIEVPAGALASAVTITITRDSLPPPAGYVALSPLYHFAPDGLTFAIPATVTFNVDNPSPLAKVQWSNPTSGGYNALATTWNGDEASASVSHFSSGFVGSEDADAGNLDADVDGGTVLEPSNLSSTSCDTLATTDLHVTANQTVDTGVDGNCDLIVTGVTPEICVIRRNVIIVDANITFAGVGTRALALIGTTSVTISGVVNVSAVLTQSGAGAADPRGQGGAPVDLVTSGAGGGYGTFGGAAGGPFGTCDAGCSSALHLPDGGPLLQGLPGAPYGTSICVPLVGGAAGSSANETYPDAGVAGGGGGALEVVSCGALSVGSQGQILAGGGGGLGGNGGTSNGQCGGGGGSGGTILLEGLSVDLSAGASVIANGGGGGSGGGASGVMTITNVNGNPGADGSMDAGPAAGGTQIVLSHTPGVAGASGGAEGAAPNSGSGLPPAVTGGCGGAGGAVGRVRINVPAGHNPTMAGAIFSPLFTDGAASMH